MKTKVRDIYWDIIKGIAILLMLLGHSIQYGYGQDYHDNCMFYDNWLFRVIYSFHMPLFMLVSGYFFYPNLQKYSMLEIVIKKIKTIFIPIISFGSLFFVLFSNGGHSIIEIMKKWGLYLYSTLSTLWFLWALLFCVFFMLIYNKLFRNLMWPLLIVILLFMIIPDFKSPVWGFKFLFPCFFVGYFLNKKRWIAYIRDNKNRFLIYFIAFFLCLICFYDADSFIYTTKINIVSSNDVLYQVCIDIYRWVIGIIGSLFIMLLALYIKVNNSLAKFCAFCGISSMGIYCFQTIYFSYIYTNIKDMADLPYYCPFTLFLSSMVFTLVVTSVVKRIPIINVLFLGGR